MASSSSNAGTSMNNVPGSALRAAAGMLLALLMPPPANAQDAKTEILWLGQSAMRIKTPGGKVIVTDPWWATRACSAT